MQEYTNQDGKILLKLARQSIEEQFTGKEVKIPEDKKLQQKRGVFVTLTENNQLRGCIGFPYPTTPLPQAITEAAKSAAFSDPRFLPLQKSELNKIKIEISILTVPEQCKPDEIKIGEDGLIAEYKGASGLLLPQVATEHNMNNQQFLEAICQKAGLSSEAYKEPDFKLYKFQAQIFSEKDL